MNLDGRVALITGGAGGTGAAHGTVFTSEGAKVLLADIDDAAGKRVAGEIGESAAYVHLDVCSTDAWQTAVSTAVDLFGHLDVLINCAGFAPMASIDSTSAELFSRTFAINTLGPFLGIQAAARVMPEGSVIINIGSVDALRGVPNVAAYSAAKAGLTSLTKSAALELAARRISVLCLQPGPIDTSMMWDAGQELMRMSGLEATREDVREMMRKFIPLGRLAQPHDIADWSAFLVFKGARIATGTDFIIDGGYICGTGAM